jgi:hypothetical protein
MADHNRRYLKDRQDPRSPFQVLRKRRQGFVPEWNTAHKGQVYVASCDGLKDGVYKIGKSTDHFSRRSQALSQPTGAPGFYFPVYRFESDLFDQLEKDIFQTLRAYRLHRRKEFVECPLEQIVKILRRRQRECAPELGFAEHFYYPIEEFEGFITGLYQDFLQQPAPRDWPLICIFLSLITGLAPAEVLIRIGHQRAALPPLLGGLLEADDVLWLIAYIRSLLKHGHVPFAEDLEDEALEWSLAWLEERLWDAIHGSPFLRKIQAFSDLPSTESFCTMLHHKACQYYGTERPETHADVERALERMRTRLDFHFI